ncbi:hypothetical protein ATY79_25130 [Rhizobium sp. R693]|nr:hypothetical protein ATY79_25130 [Rhizobium sp. R693]
MLGYPDRAMLARQFLLKEPATLPGAIEQHLPLLLRKGRAFACSQSAKFLPGRITRYHLY